MSSFSHSHRSLDFVIPGDQLEYDRRQLEHTLKNYDPDFSPASSDRYLSDSHSIEQGRRTSAPPHNDFASFEHPSFDHFGPEDRSRGHGWSYRSDDEGIAPYGTQTISTAAHHASALTFSAGLTRAGGRRDASISGAEFDPERPLSEMIANVRDKFSFLETSKSKSKLNAEPIVVEDTAEIDQILNNGHSLAQGNLSARLRRTHSSTASSSETESPPRPNLAQALDQVSFSPRRPRNVPARVPQRQVDEDATPVAHRQQPPSHARKSSQPTVQETSRPQQRRLPSAMAIPQGKTHHQATSQNSRFTKMARSINQDLENERQARNAKPTPDSAQRKRTVNFDLSRQSALLNHEASLLRSRVHLPDFTGLTSAVESPARVRMQHRTYHGRPQKADDLLPSLDALHKKLLSLETENSISRRRVMELEMELRAAQQEAKMREQQERVESRSGGRIGRGVQAQLPQRSDADEAQKALEALVNTLRGHLTRLTAELSSQRELLVELREQRESDREHSRDKSLEIEQLKAEVERLAGEVEVLRGVVEEGLEETRAATRRRPDTGRNSEAQDKADIDRSFSQAADDEEEDRAQVPPRVPALRVSSPAVTASPRMTAQEVLARSMSLSRSSTPVGYKRDHSPPRPPSVRAPSSQAPSRSSSPARSLGSSGSRQDGYEDASFILHNRPPSVIEHVEPEKEESEKEEAEQSDHEHHANVLRYEPENTRPARPSAPTPSHAAVPLRQGSSSSHRSRRSRRQSPSPSDAFPRIRGHRMEKMFFAAREHDSKKCSTCKRRYQPAKEENVETMPPWLFKKPRSSQHRDANEDEGFVEGTSPPLAHRRERQTVEQPNTRTMPPQTVLSKVLRELEDDFSHYKSIYVEMAEQYKFLDAVSDVPRRKALARHLHDIIELLEQKGDQITSLYDLLKFEDKPVA